MKPRLGPICHQQLASLTRTPEKAEARGFDREWETAVSVGISAGGHRECGVGGEGREHPQTDQDAALAVEGAD
jgi:hypothetical protein